VGYCVGEEYWCGSRALVRKDCIACKKNKKRTMLWYLMLQLCLGRPDSFARGVIPYEHLLTYAKFVGAIAVVFYISESNRGWSRQTCRKIVHVGVGVVWYALGEQIHPMLIATIAAGWYTFIFPTSHITRDRAVIDAEVLAYCFTLVAISYITRDSALLRYPSLVSAVADPMGYIIGNLTPSRFRVVWYETTQTQKTVTGTAAVAIVTACIFHFIGTHSIGVSVAYGLVIGAIEALAGASDNICIGVANVLVIACMK
jgi:hypothetical protein